MMRKQVMTNKQIVEDFLNFLYIKEGLISTPTGHVYTYKELRTALMEYSKECIDESYRQGKLDGETDYDDTLISGKEDW